MLTQVRFSNEPVLDKLLVGLGLGLFLDRNVVPGSTIDVVPGTCLTWQNNVDHDLRKLVLYRTFRT